ncbi:putative E3 ubiquitin-protein ligase SINA-like 9 [Harmonia axyridis]|uniref:putative E3 ubiquitin-protein ligase SINA-like 9 n=1 Tax=Harmonia axyridis TaxID=115357 RepID=UPI001E275FCB|nr:putative E3 ubiquitin-protein ligase SINA-like 9 [Harmonia axyridis]
MQFICFSNTKKYTKNFVNKNSCVLLIKFGQFCKMLRRVQAKIDKKRFVLEYHHQFPTVLTCKNCEKFCHPPFYMCKNLHMYCAMCGLKRSICLKCQCFVYKNNMKLLRTMYENVNFPCENRLLGCSVVAKGSCVAKHQKSCSYTIITCPVPLCSFSYPVQNIFDHFEAEHSTFVYPDNVYQKRIFFSDLMSECIILKNIIQHFGMVFLVRIFVSLTQNFIRYVSVNIGPFKDVEKYAAVIFFEQLEDKAWALVTGCNYIKNGIIPDSKFARKNISELKMHEDFYFAHEVGISRKFD